MEEPETVSKGALMAGRALLRMVKRAEVETDTAVERLGLDFSQHTNVELNIIEAAARAERRRRWLATMGRNDGNSTTKA